MVTMAGQPSEPVEESKLDKHSDRDVHARVHDLFKLQCPTTLTSVYRVALPFIGTFQN